MVVHFVLEVTHPGQDWNQQDLYLDPMMRLNFADEGESEMTVLVENRPPGLDEGY